MGWLLVPPFLLALAYVAFERGCETIARCVGRALR